MRWLLVGLLLAVGSTSVPAQSRQSSELRDLDRWITRAIHDWEVPGLAVAVVHGDSVVFAKGYGVRALGSDQPVTTSTLFANASTTKAFTSLGVALMVDAGSLAWDDRVADRLPALVLRDPYPARELRIRDLLSHRAGFGDPSFLWYGTELDVAEMFRRVRFVEPESSFRSRYAYNNVTYAAAGVIAGEAYGAGWDALVRERILVPLAMTATVTQGRFLPVGGDVAQPHDRVNDTLRVIAGVGSLVDGIAPAGAMYSNVLDMSRWLRFLLGGGRVGDSVLVQPETFAEVFRPQTIIPTSSFYPTARRTHPHFTAYGMGWFLQDYQGAFVAFHTGSIDGYVAIVGLLPDRDVGVVVFANRDHAELRHAIMWKVFDAYLGTGDRDWSLELKAMYDSLDAQQVERRHAREAQRVAHTSPSLPLPAFAGTYADSAHGTVTVRLEGGGLRFVQSPFLAGTLEHWHYDTFVIRWDHAWITPDFVVFELGSGGEVEAASVGEVRLGRVRAGAAAVR
jgi:CubicO group peptidase (beta-lactamase class C family)